MQITAETRTDLGAGARPPEGEQLAHAISHDLAQPLTTISGFARLLISRYDLDLDDETRGQLEEITKQAAEMQEAIDQSVSALRSTEPHHAVVA
jgi:light-regulated signal transduction histidine kinase (bacteriophytochrome)